MSFKNLKPAAMMRFSVLMSVLSLGIALISQYGFGLKPCHLCIAQRIPYGVVILLGMISWKWAKSRIWMIRLSALCFLIGSGIGFYHTGVEKKWISGPISCTTESGGEQQSTDDFLKRIQNAPVVACDQPQWEYHGITMAGLNGVWSLLLAAVVFAALQQNRKGTADA